jgi:CheY-like chemotaxis protein
MEAGRRFRVVPRGKQHADFSCRRSRGHAQRPDGLLTRWGYIVSSADTLKGGLDLLDSEPPPDVVLSDIALPDGTGYALVSEARRKGKRVLAIALSGYAYPSDVRIAKLTGFDHHLSKPCDCGYLRTILRDRARWDKRSKLGKD